MKQRLTAKEKSRRLYAGLRRRRQKKDEALTFKWLDIYAMVTAALDHGSCMFCGDHLTVKTVSADHLTPLDRGGSDDLDNLAACCWPCNQAKGNMTDAEYGRLMQFVESLPDFVRGRFMGALRTGATLRLGFARRGKAA